MQFSIDWSQNCNHHKFQELHGAILSEWTTAMERVTRRCQVSMTMETSLAMSTGSAILNHTLPHHTIKLDADSGDKEHLTHDVDVFAIKKIGQLWNRKSLVAKTAKSSISNLRRKAF